MQALPSPSTLSVERGIRVLAGVMVLLGVALSFAHPGWLALPVFVAANLIQSAFTGFCPAERVLKRIGFGASCCSNGQDSGRSA